MSNTCKSILGCLVIIIIGVNILTAQAVKWKPDPNLPQPPVKYHGLMPGISSLQELRKVLGKPIHENTWYSYKLLYAAKERPGNFDSIHLQSRDGKSGTLGSIEAASIPPGFENWKKVHESLGEPEFFLQLYRHGIADYSSRGLRFIFNSRDEAIGVAYVPHGKTRVHEGERRFLSLRHLPQGPQPALPNMPDMGDLRAGAAEVDLTPKLAEWLGPASLKGEFRVHDALKARCAVLDRDGFRVAIVGADLFGISKSEVDPIEKELRKHGIHHLLLASSHNHAAMDTIGIYGFYPAKYINYIQTQIRTGVLTAAKNLRPVKKWIAGSDELPLDGARVQGLIRNARNPGLVDPQMAVMQAVDEDNKPIVTFVHLACHVEGLKTGIMEASADFPGYFCDELKSKIGGHVVFLNGALGGMVTGDTIARTHEEAEKAGKTLANEALRILSFATSPGKMRIVFERYRLELPLTNSKFILFMTLSNRRKLVRGRIVTEMNYLRIGDAEIITIPGELLPEVSFEILEHMKGYPRMIVGLANDQLGYLLPGSDFNSDEYEESMSVGPVGGVMVRDQAIRILQSQREPGRFRRK